MIELNGKKFASTEQELTESLFNPGGTLNFLSETELKNLLDQGYMTTSSPWSKNELKSYALYDHETNFLGYILVKNNPIENKPDNKLNIMNEGKLKKCLDKLYRFDSGIMTLGDWLEYNKNKFDYKGTHIRNHSSKRIELEYKKIKDTYTYTIWLKNGHGIDIPKMVYDTLNVPEKITDNRF